MTSTTIPTWELKDRCLKAREFGGFKRQEDLAEASTISIRTISRYESGETRHPNRSIIAQWSLACGVPFEWLMFGIVADPSSPGGDSAEKSVSSDTMRGCPQWAGDLPIGDVLGGARAS